MNYPVILETEDGYTFYLLRSNRVVDNLDASRVDMSWHSLNAFIESQR